MGRHAGGQAWSAGAARAARELRRRTARGRLPADGRVRDRLADVLRTSAEWSWAVDAGGRITWSSPGSVRLLGRSPEQLVGRPARDLLAPGEPRRLRAVLARRLPGEDLVEGLVVRLRHADGSWRDVVTTVAVPTAGPGAGWVGSTRPVEPGTRYGTDLRGRRERIRRIIDLRRLDTAFQPIVDLTSGTVAGFEALSRFQPDGEDAAPEQVFRQAAEVGLETELEVTAVERALDTASVLPPEVYLSVNVSPATLVSAPLQRVLGASPWPLNRLVLEVTEHTSVPDYAALRRPLDRLRARGARVAVDDAGAGFASFRHVLALRPDYIKLDRELVTSLDRDPARRALAAAVVMVALEIGAEVVAEGVETRAELDVVALLGIDAAQGYLLGRPCLGRPDPEQGARRPRAQGRVRTSAG